MLTGSNIDTHQGLLIFQSLCLDAAACEPALDHISACIAEGISLRECMDCAPSAKDQRAWALWCRVNLSASMDDEVRSIFGELATVADARTAAQLCVDRDDLGQDEALVLLSRWHSALNETGEPIFPVIELELSQQDGS